MSPLLRSKVKNVFCCIDSKANTAQESLQPQNIGPGPYLSRCESRYKESGFELQIRTAYGLQGNGCSDQIPMIGHAAYVQCCARRINRYGRDAPQLSEFRIKDTPGGACVDNHGNGVSTGDNGHDNTCVVPIIRVVLI